MPYHPHAAICVHVTSSFVIGVHVAEVSDISDHVTSSEVIVIHFFLPIATVPDVVLTIPLVLCTRLQVAVMVVSGWEVAEPCQIFSESATNDADGVHDAIPPNVPNPNTVILALAVGVPEPNLTLLQIAAMVAVDVIGATPDKVACPIVAVPDVTLDNAPASLTLLHAATKVAVEVIVPLPIATITAAEVTVLVALAVILPR